MVYSQFGKDQLLSDMSDRKRSTCVNDWHAEHSKRVLFITVSPYCWKLAALTTRSRKRLRKIPGAVALRNWLLRR
jgi:hypothetical protein